MLSCAGGREEHCKQILLACVGSARSEWTTLGLPQLKAVCAFLVYTAQALGCSAGHCSKRAMHFLCFPGLSCSASWILCKGTDSVGRVFCALPRSKLLRRPGAWGAHCPTWAMCLNHFPIRAAWFLGVPREHHLRCAVCLLWEADLRQ